MATQPTDAPQSDAASAPARTIMPPHLVLQEFLDPATAAGLLDFTLANESAFTPTKTGRDKEGKIDAGMRVSVGTPDLGPFKPILKDCVLAVLPDLIAKLGTTPIEAPAIELELVAHNDGAFYRAHIDTQTAATRHTLRVLSAVYYFNSEPKAFSGGELRLFALGDRRHATYVDVEPTQNTLLVFPSWAPHEVRPVSCPSRRFADSRFAVNCWVHRPHKAVAS